MTNAYQTKSKYQAIVYHNDRIHNIIPILTKCFPFPLYAADALGGS